MRQQVRAARVTLADRRGGQLEVTCLIATEINAPQGETPIEWRLLTNRAVEDFAAAAELVDWYRVRWEIELFFLVLKQGCRVELPPAEVARDAFGMIALRLFDRGAGCLNWARPDLWEPRLSNQPRPPGKYAVARIFQLAKRERGFRFAPFFRRLGH